MRLQGAIDQALYHGNSAPLIFVGVILAIVLFKFLAGLDLNNKW